MPTILTDDRPTGRLHLVVLRKIARFCLTKFAAFAVFCCLISPVWADVIRGASRAGNVALVSIYSQKPNAPITSELWSLQPWKRRCALQGQPDVSEPTFSEDGRLMAFGFKDSTTEIYRTDNGALWKRLGRPQNLAGIDYKYFQVRAIAFSPDRKMLVSANVKGLFFWDVNTKKLKLSRPLSIELWNNYVRSVAVKLLQFSPDGKTLAIGGGSQFPVLLYDVARKRVRLKLQLHAEDGRALAIAFSPNGKRLMVAGYYNVSAASYNKLFLFDTRNGRALWRWNNRSNHPLAYDTASFYTNAVFASDGRRFALNNERFLEIRSARDGHLLLQRLHKGNDYPTLQQQRQLLPALAVR